MNNTKSLQFRQMANIINKAIFDVYEEAKYQSLTSVRVDRLRSGSVISEITLNYNVTIKEDFLKPLKDALSKGEIGGEPVSSKQSDIDGCKYLECEGEHKQCQFYNNMTFPRCVCSKGFYLGADDQTCLAGCTPGFCLNGGYCERNAQGRSCRCPSNYKGDRCQTKDEDKHEGLIVGVTIGAVVFIAFILYCLKAQSKRGSSEWKEKPLTDDVEVNMQPMENISSTPIVVRVSQRDSTMRGDDDKPVPTMGIENEGADLEDGAQETKTSTLTVQLKPKSQPSPATNDKSILIPNEGDKISRSSSTSSGSSRSSSSSEELKN
ncbi:protocadherin Fat 2-like [Clytia hemisphaerica]